MTPSSAGGGGAPIVYKKNNKNYFSFKQQQQNSKKIQKIFKNQKNLTAEASFGSVPKLAETDANAPAVGISCLLREEYVNNITKMF